MNQCKKWKEKPTTSPSGRRLGNYHVLFHAFSYVNNDEKKEIEKMRNAVI